MNGITKQIADHFDAAAELARCNAAIARIDPVADPAQLARCTATAQAMLTNGRSLVQPNAEAVAFSVRNYIEGGGDAEIDEAPTDKEIAEFGKACGLEPMAWVARLEAFCVQARAEAIP